MKSGLEINLERILEEKFFQDSFLRFSAGTKNVLLKQLKDWYLPLFVSSFYFPQISIGNTFLVDKIIRSLLLYISKIE